jgi:hypothetical protein
MGIISSMMDLLTMDIETPRSATSFSYTSWFLLGGGSSGFASGSSTPGFYLNV